MQLACNAHTICDSELRPLGTGLYPVISIINHRFFFGLLLSIFSSIASWNEYFPILYSVLRFLLTILTMLNKSYNYSCIPNSVLVFEGPVAFVRAVAPIPKGTEVSLPLKPVHHILSLVLCSFIADRTSFFR